MVVVRNMRHLHIEYIIRPRYVIPRLFRGFSAAIIIAARYSEEFNDFLPQRKKYWIPFWILCSVRLQIDWFSSLYKVSVSSRRGLHEIKPGANSNYLSVWSSFTIERIIREQTFFIRQWNIMITLNWKVLDNFAWKEVQCWWEFLENLNIFRQLNNYFWSIIRGKWRNKLYNV